MKNNNINNYSLNADESYKKENECDLNEAIKKYTELIFEYYNFILENIKTKKGSLNKFIIIRGLDTVTNVFFQLLYYTKNIELTYFHCQKAFYFYVEFVGQISDDEKMFLQLTSRDATFYVYKKTIFDINNEIKKNNEVISDEYRENLEVIKSFINILQLYLLKLINSNEYGNVKSKMNIFLHLINKLNNIKHKIVMTKLESVLYVLYDKIDDIDLFFYINEELINKYLKNKVIINDLNAKLHSDELSDRLSDKVLDKTKLINWLLT